jgi:hypothetical protein
MPVYESILLRTRQGLSVQTDNKQTAAGLTYEEEDTCQCTSLYYSERGNDSVYKQTTNRQLQA